MEKEEILEEEVKLQKTEYEAALERVAKSPLAQFPQLSPAEKKND